MTCTIWPDPALPLIEVMWFDNGRIKVKKSRKLRKAALLLVSAALVTQFQKVHYPPLEFEDDD